MALENIPISKFKKKLGLYTLECFYQGKSFLITQYGTPQAVLVGIKEFQEKFLQVEKKEISVDTKERVFVQLNRQRNLMIVSLHLQGYKGPEIGALFGLTREWIRRIIKASGMKLDMYAFRIVRLHRLYPQEMIECECGCGQTLLRYGYYYKRPSAYERRYIKGHWFNDMDMPGYERTEEIRHKNSEATKKAWIDGKYISRHYGAVTEMGRGENDEQKALS